MNNKGFTLIELLAVIVILVGISLIAVTGISASLERRNEKECYEQVELAINTAKIYFSLNSDIKQVTVEELVAQGYFDDKKIDKLDSNDKINITSSGYTYNDELDTSLVDCNK